MELRPSALARQLDKYRSTRVWCLGGDVCIDVKPTKETDCYTITNKLGDDYKVRYDIHEELIEIWKGDTKVHTEILYRKREDVLFPSKTITRTISVQYYRFFLSGTYEGLKPEEINFLHQFLYEMEIDNDGILPEIAGVHSSYSVDVGRCDVSGEDVQATPLISVDWVRTGKSYV